MSCPYCHQPRPNAIHTSTSQLTEIEPPRSANVVQHPKHGNEQLAGNHLLDNCELPPTFFENSEAEVAYICRETRRLDALISQLNEERAALRRRRNHLQSRTSVLSPEILAVVFEHLCLSQHAVYPENRIECPQLVLSAVSSLWRQVVRSTPVPWTSAAFRFSNVREKTALLRLFLENSGSLPLTLRLDIAYFRSWRPDDDTLVHPTIDELLIMNLPRVQELHLISPSKKWLYSTHHLSQLTTFSLDSFTGDFSLLGHGLRFQNSPLLRRLHLSSVSQEQDDTSPPLNIDLPFVHTITHLDLSTVPAHICVELLTRCSNLIECYIWFPYSTRGEVQLPTIALPRLETFLWYATMIPGVHSILPCIHTPSLRTLRFKADHSASTLSFFSRLPPSLSTLELYSIHSDELTLQDLVREVSNVETLTLVNFDPEVALGILFDLRSYDQREDRLLPRLKNLSLRVEREDWVPIGQRIHADASLGIARGLRKRMNDPNSDQFCLTLDCIWVEWLRQAKQGLKYLVDDGFRIEIHQREISDSDWTTLDLS